MADWLANALPTGTPAHAGLALVHLAQEKAMARGGLKLTSPAFEGGEELDPCFTADEEDAVAPPLEWSAPPPGAQELVVIVEDASSEGPTCHWLVWGLAPQRGKLLEGETPPRVGKNSMGNSEWLLPALPKDDDPHTFVFQLYALDLPMTLMPGATREQLFKAMEGHVMAAAVLTATYQASDEEDWVEEGENDFA
ncbi:YbhB/YbcL family Raf kinase inhibitor-like protein [Parerythrobacter jejuensis]|uniref:YbhB/YbcL family Raf kinase inhibitor-like protein n=1 Tax=Parerythrobacter jejuensis TaxID=795812 RepID=A0A845AN80_9SPHN|nr:YbhB/YbcL family Raf kinase inhibitor-like protein [Parerythrobacter jejuensis]MXP30311.1 YbhB/YbcL family Raf kinase inhibitor-like protein [Parerythrobacter jejuensis]MXP33071.1 YbhB/YbcL family Raf kinase inhibitor-like protein [Parerythrobacter jejuensis]